MYLAKNIITGKLLFTEGTYLEYPWRFVPVVINSYGSVHMKQKITDFEFSQIVDEYNEMINLGFNFEDENQKKLFKLKRTKNTFHL